ncbi:HNH endonuclease [Janthinobacterium sp. P210005]|uniref:HNH endonuclease n=1 Tax=Janthinobacterium sp. P210005 TaxID=3112938 RepID=UPI002E2606C1
MKSLCVDSIQLGHLAKLVMLIRSGSINGTQAWSAFSSPENSKILKLRDGTSQTFKFSLAERKTYDFIREVAQKKIYEKYGRICSYCRRPVGHYGYSWHIEHVLPKSIYPSLTFKLANLIPACVDCNRWKGVRVDKYVKNKKLSIINPLDSGFKYSSHLRYLQIGTEDISFAKYIPNPGSAEGMATYKNLSFSEIEMAHAIDRLDPITSALHERLTRAMSIGLAAKDAKNFLNLLGEIKSAIYSRP